MTAIFQSLIFPLYFRREGGEDVINKAIVAGRLVKDPSLRQAANNTTIATFSLAVDRGISKNGERSTDFLMCKAFNKTAVNISKYCSKGSFVCITGQFHSNRYEKDGKTHYSTEILVENIKFLPNIGGNKAEKSESRSDAVWNSLPDEIKDKVAQNLIVKGTEQLIQSTAEERWNSKLFGVEDGEEKTPSEYAAQADEIIKVATNNEAQIDNTSTEDEEEVQEDSNQSEDASVSDVTDSSTPF
ncbi:single-stranded DNA-binding protein [Macrococcoides canis]|nr:single-stranded DNA-binding protein [Macrococcus canis]